VWIKVCGICRQEDALAAAKAGAQAIGFVFAPSPRQLPPQKARELARDLPKGLFRVGVFVDEKPEEVERIARFVGLDLLQFHGTESQQYCSYFKGLPWGLIKAWRMEEDNFDGVAAYKGLVSALLLDSSAGSGRAFPWQKVREVPWDGKLILAGGLGSENVGQAIAEVAPWGVDASSRLESRPGCKDPDKVMAFVERALEAGRELDEAKLAK